jgi:hypothetical protein
MVKRDKCTKCGKTIVVRGEEPIGVVVHDIGIMVNCPAEGCGFPNPFEWTSDMPHSASIEER